MAALRCDIADFLSGSFLFRDDSSYDNGENHLPVGKVAGIWVVRHAAGRGVVTLM